MGSECAVASGQLGDGVIVEGCWLTEQEYFAIPRGAMSQPSSINQEMLFREQCPRYELATSRLGFA